MKKINKREAEVEAGTILEIPFGEHHTYARKLNYGDYAFYDFKTKEDVKDLNSIVNHRGLIEGFWKPVGNIPLEKELQNSIYYWSGPVDPNEFRISENGDIRNVSKEECIGLEIHGVWDPIHIEQRLKDHYAGVENAAVKMLDVLGNYKLKK
jgi:hypothetical protein